ASKTDETAKEAGLEAIPEEANCCKGQSLEACRATPSTTSSYSLPNQDCHPEPSRNCYSDPSHNCYSDPSQNCYRSQNSYLGPSQSSYLDRSQSPENCYPDRVLATPQKACGPTFVKPVSPAPATSPTALRRVKGKSTADPKDDMIRKLQA
ncbi:unnamed protein product, partial [Symbiodinium sp. KB8]